MLKPQVNVNELGSYQNERLVSDLLHSKLSVILSPAHRGKTHFSLYLSALLTVYRKVTYISDETPLSLIEAIINKYEIADEDSSIYLGNFTSFSVPTNDDFNAIKLEIDNFVVMDLACAIGHPYLEAFVSKCTQLSIPVLLTVNALKASGTCAAEFIQNLSWIKDKQELVFNDIASPYSADYSWKVAYPKYDKYARVSIPKDNSLIEKLFNNYSGDNHGTEAK